MNKIVFDASAVLILLNQEKGYNVVETHLPYAVMSMVNVCEVAAVLIYLGISVSRAREIILEIIKEIVPFDVDQAFISANMRGLSKSYGLSLGDRACMALAKSKKLPVLTADKAWEKINRDVKVILIR